MRRILLIALAVLPGVAAQVAAQEKPRAYPITLDAKDVHEIADLAIELNGLKLQCKDALVVPIRCEPGITGAMLLGTGKYEFAPKDGEPIRGAFRACMLRFNPDDQSRLLPLDNARVIEGRAAHEMSRHLLDNVFRHCWHSGKDALIPDRGSFVADVYSTTQGDVLISTGSKSSIVHSFTENKTLYQSK